MALTDVKSEQIQSSVALAGSPTTTTQSASDNSTKIATTAYVETAVANLVASAPAALNTLDELAAALNDDASFSTTVTNSIATKLPLAGGTMSGALNMGSQNITNAGTIAGTIATAAQTNITSLGTLTGLNVNGDIDATNVDASNTVYVGTNNSFFRENVVRFKSAGAAYFDHETVGQSFIFRVSNSSSFDTTALTIASSGNTTFNGEVTFNDDIGLGMNGAAFGSGVPTINFRGTSNSNTRAGALLFKENNDDDVAALYVTDGQDGYGTVLAAYQGDIKFSTGTLAGYKMVIASDGIVTIRPDTGATTGTLRLHNGNGNGTLGQLDFGHSGSVHHGSILYTGNMDFHTGGSADSRFFIGQNGEIGINTTSPEHHLHVTEPGTSKEDGIVKIGGSSSGLGLELKYDQTGATTTEIVANPTYTNVSSLMRICVDRDANANQISLLGSGLIGMGTDSPYSNARLTLAGGGIRFPTNPYSAGSAFNVVAAVTISNSNQTNIVQIHNKSGFVTIVDGGGQATFHFISCGGSGVAYQWTFLRPDSATPVHGGSLSITFNMEGSTGQDYYVGTGSGNGYLHVTRYNGSDTYRVYVSIFSG